MNIIQITNNPDFKGRVVISKKLSKENKSLFNSHKFALEQMMRELPFDLFVKQSNKKKIITFNTNVEGTGIYQVYQRKKNLMEAAANAVYDAKGKSEAYKKMMKANEILEYVKLFMFNIISGRFKEAREAQKTVAKLGVENFEIYKAMTNFELTGFPREMNKILFFNSIKYKIYNLFSQKTNEEKQLKKMNKAYYKEMKAKNIEIKPVKLELPGIYY